ncbi:MAG: T9SS type A sorting domain-containing protein [Flavobacteriales bacterium]|nr:T9SS type A sorting domain-containing protein [Flavobacteriales bacterium]
MITHPQLFNVAFASSLLLFVGESTAQCTNTSLYPSQAIIPNAGGAITTISTCNFQTEYARITGIVAGSNYQFTISDGSFITVHKGTFNGPVLGFGVSPLNILGATGEDLFAHWNANNACGTAQNCLLTTVQRFLDCLPPQSTVLVTNDCPNEQFFVDVNVLNTGDAPTIALTYTVNGGAPVTQPGLSAGAYQLGPFADLSVIDLTVEHSEDSSCNVSFLDLTNDPCGIVSCGPDTYTHCYGNSENYVQTYQGNSTFPLRLIFNSGNVSGSGNDMLVIRDGLSVTDPVLFSGVGNAGNLTGVTVLSTNPDHALTLTMTSNSSFSCADGGVSPPWNYTVGCLDCTAPLATAGNVITNCASQSFTVQVNVSNMGSATNLSITNNVGAPSTVVSATGTYTAGPFPVGSAAILTLVNSENALCNLALGSFINSFCAVEITCGEPPIEASYCYDDSDSEAWLYQNTGSESLALLFSAGSIESVSFDQLVIYDGVNNQAPVIWQHTGGNEQLAGVLAISTGTSIFMEMSSDNSISCGAGSTQITEWFWTVGCLDCTQPVSTYEVVLDCDSSQFYIATNITSLGSDTTPTITNTGGAPSIPVSSTGTYNVGPFPAGGTVRVDVVSDENSLCSVHSPFLTSAPCPLIGCGPYQFDLCYGDGMDTTVVFQSCGSFPLAVYFNAGQIDLFGDNVIVYDGPDFQAPVLFNGNNNGDLSGLIFTSTNPENALCLRFTSDFFESCGDGSFQTPWNWSVSCLDCTNPSATFEVVPDCLHHSYNIAVDVSNLGSASDLRITDSWTMDTLIAVGIGTTIVGPIPVDEVAHVTVLNSLNPLCRVNSDEFFYPAENCVVTACDPLGVEYCYTNSDTAWFVYQSGMSVPVTISFGFGQLLSNDNIQLYNGIDASAQLVYQGNAGGQVGGLALSSSNPDNALTMKIGSNATGSCATGEASPSLYWTVGCGLVGETENGFIGFSIFPNPAGAEFYIRPSTEVSGPANLEVFDVTGRLVMKEGFPAGPGATFMFRSVGLQNGNYAVRLSTPDGQWTQQVQVVH